MLPLLLSCLILLWRERSALASDRLFSRIISSFDRLTPGIEADFVALVHLTDAGTRSAMEFSGVAITNI